MMMRRELPLLFTQRTPATTTPVMPTYQTIIKGKVKGKAPSSPVFGGLNGFMILET